MNDQMRLRELDAEIKYAMDIQNWITVGMLKAEREEILKRIQPDKDLDFLKAIFGIK